MINRVKTCVIVLAKIMDMYLGYLLAGKSLNRRGRSCTIWATLLMVFNLCTMIVTDCYQFKQATLLMFSNLCTMIVTDCYRVQYEDHGCH